MIVCCVSCLFVMFFFVSASNCNVNMKDSIIVGGLEEGLLNVLSGCWRSVATQDPEKRFLNREFF